MILEKLYIHIPKKKKNCLDTDLKLSTKLTQNDLNVKWKTIKLLKYNTGKNPDDLGYVDDFLDTTPTA